jgi:hypothetical protein
MNWRSIQARMPWCGTATVAHRQAHRLVPPGAARAVGGMLQQWPVIAMSMHDFHAGET